MRVVFCGTPQFAVPSLQALLEAGHDVPLVLAQPDRPVGRKQVVTAPPVKLLAIQRGIPVTQPERLKTNRELEQQLRELSPDVIVVVAYGRIVPSWMLHLPRFGNVNVHGSLLPKYRGAAPVQWALANGETETGVTTMLLDEGLDTGPTLWHRALSIGEDETAVELLPRLALAGATLLVETLAGLQDGSIHAQTQDENLATLAPILSRGDGRVDFLRPAREIYDRWRGFSPWPGAFAEFRGANFSMLKMRRCESSSEEAPGSLRAAGDRLFVTCSDHVELELLEVQAAGKRATTAAQFLHGVRLEPGERLR